MPALLPAIVRHPDKSLHECCVQKIHINPSSLYVQLMFH
jgi:hypothetical protein